MLSIGHSCGAVQLVLTARAAREHTRAYPFVPDAYFPNPILQMLF